MFHHVYNTLHISVLYYYDSNLCFRLYPVDKSRPNEFGVSYEDQDQKPDAVPESKKTK